MRRRADRNDIALAEAPLALAQLAHDAGGEVHHALRAAVHRPYHWPHHRLPLEEFAARYVKGLRANKKRGEIRKGDAEEYAWALMGIGDIGRRFALWDAKASLKGVAQWRGGCHVRFD